MKKCSCGKSDYQFEIDEFGQGWMLCRKCGDSLFEENIGVILINWTATNPQKLRVEIKGHEAAD